METEKSKETLWKYIHSMYLYADQSQRDINLTKVMKTIQKKLLSNSFLEVG